MRHLNSNGVEFFRVSSYCFLSTNEITSQKNKKGTELFKHLALITSELFDGERVEVKILRQFCNS